MNTILNFAEHELENGIYKELEPILKVLLHRVIHREVGKLSKRQVNNGVWEPLPGSLSAQMWSVFEHEHLNRISPDFKKLNLIGLSNNWPYKAIFAEYERWRRYAL